jgi:hypothetical protein
MVHCWNALKEGPKWRLGVVAYMANVKNGTPGVTMTIDGEDKVPCHNAMPSHPRGHKSTKADLSREASSIALSETLKSMMAESQKRPEKETSASIYIDLTKQAIAVQRLDAEANSRTEETQIMFADLSTMDGDQLAWFEKKRTKIWLQEA